MSRELTVLPDRETFIATVARATEDVIVGSLRSRGIAHVVLTGGTMGVAVLTGIASPDAQPIDWTRVHLWWGDERFVASNSADRNSNQARDALISRLDIPGANVHEMPASDAGLSLDDAAKKYGDELKRFSDEGSFVPVFDLTLLGIGPDSHVASLFPGHEDARKPGYVVSVRNSPKPPPERISLTFSSINASERVWVVASGADKAEAVAAMFSASDNPAVPGSCVHGKIETRVWADESAAALIV